MRKTKQYACKNCNKEYESVNSGSKFCSKTCSAVFNNKKRGRRSEETKNKIRNSLKGRCIGNSKGKERVSRKCLNCGIEFLPAKRWRKYCSFKCSLEGRGCGIKGEISYRTFRKMLYRAFPNWHCPFCDWDCNFEIHHIDGRKIERANHTSKLIMLCPNHPWKADNGLIDRDDLLKHSVGMKYSKEELLSRFYEGENNEVKPKTDQSNTLKRLNRQRNEKINFN